jgi:uncharacterized repeat protein (TIGR01451 family)
MVPDSFASPRQTLKMNRRSAWANLAPVERLASTNHISLSLGLPLKNTDTLTNLLRELYDPSSTNYGHYLKPDEFTVRFSPSEADYLSIINFAKSNHLDIRMTHANRTLVGVEGSVSDIEQAFGVKLHSYRHPHESRMFHAPDSEPTVDAALPMISVDGLDDFKIPHPMGTHMIQPNGLVPQAGTGFSGSLLGYDFRSAYVPGTTLNGSGQSVALFEVDGYYASDIALYQSVAGLPGGTVVSNILVDGFSGAAGANNMEVAMDIEMAIAMAPGLSRVLVYEGPNQNNVTTPNDILNKIATDNLASQISCSWNFNLNTNTEQIFLQFAAQGQSFFLASGDSGAFSGGVTPPSDDPYITVVGGTTLTMNNGSYQSERVWNWRSDGTGTNASSGGVSSVYPLPAWQQGVSMANNQGSTLYRNTPDVALTADGIEVVYNNGTGGIVGGTSAAAPLWAGLAALINQQAAANGRPPVGFLNPALYNIAKGARYNSAFHDVTTGNNTNPASSNQFFATPGYDLCTGWGTPAGTNLINLLAPPQNQAVITASAILSSENGVPANGAIDPYETVSLNLSLTNIGGRATTNLVATLLTNTGVTLPGGPVSFGAIPGGGGIRTLPVSFSALGVCGSTLSLGVKLTDGTSDLGTLNLNYVLGQTVSFTNISQNFDGITAPALPAGWNSQNSGTQNWVTVNGVRDTLPNSIFCANSAKAGVSYLLSPNFAVNSTAAQVTFRQNYYFEYNGSANYDGGVLEISVNGGAFSDLISAGGGFISGGYNGTLYNTASLNPLAGRNAWVGKTTGFATVVAQLPSSCAGRNVQLRWTCGTGNGNTYASGGWYLDSLVVKDSYISCTTPSADLVAGASIAPSNLVAGQAGVCTLAVSNAGPSLAAGVVITDVLPGNITVTTLPAGCSIGGGMLTCSVGTLAVGSVTNFACGFILNSATVSSHSISVTSFTPDFFPGNNSTYVTNPVQQVVPPAIVSQPSNVVASANTSATLGVAASGSGPLGYKWMFNNTALNAGNVPQLNFTNLQPAHAGLYQVIVTNSCGTATSTVASVCIKGTPVSFDTRPGAMRCTNGTFYMPVMGLTGQGPVVIQASCDLKNWVSISTNPGGFGQFIFADTNAGANCSRFYRAYIVSP